MHTESVTIHSYMKDATFITLGSHRYSRALLIKAALETASINCLMTPSDILLNGIDIRVNADDLIKAKKIHDEVVAAFGAEKQKTVNILRSVRRILVPVDFSAESRKAAFYALRLAQTLKADIRLINAWFPAAAENFSWGDMYAFQPDFEEQLKETEASALKQLTELQDELFAVIRDERIHGVDIDVDLLRGSPSDAISAVAHHYKPGLIVMGTKGRHRFARGFFGSTTARAIERGKIPVLAIPPSYDESQFRSASNILYLTNFDQSDFESLHKLLVFVRPFKAKVFCLHVHQKGSLALDEARMQEMRALFDREYSHYAVECGLLQSEHILEGVEDFIQSKKIDVMAVTARRQGLIEQLFQPSLSQLVLFRTRIPLLVFGGV